MPWILAPVSQKSLCAADIYLFSCCAKQVGTLDVLVGLSDELAKLDSFVERYTSALSLYFNLHIFTCHHSPHCYMLS